MKRDKLAKDIKKTAKRLSRDVKDSLDDLPGTTTTKIVAGAAGLAAAGALGVAVTRKTRKKSKAYHVVPADEGWEITLEGQKKPVGVFPAKRAAVSAARETASAEAPSTLAIHGKSGKILRGA